MLNAAQRERILSHLRRGWKLPDSLVQELWDAYEALASTQDGPDQGHSHAPDISPASADAHVNPRRHNGAFEPRY